MPFPPGWLLQRVICGQPGSPDTRGLSGPGGGGHTLLSSLRTTFLMISLVLWQWTEAVFQREARERHRLVMGRNEKQNIWQTKSVSSRACHHVQSCLLQSEDKMSDWCPKTNGFWKDTKTAPILDTWQVIKKLLMKKYKEQLYSEIVTEICHDMGLNFLMVPWNCLLNYEVKVCNGLMCVVGGKSCL